MEAESFEKGAGDYLTAVTGSIHPLYDCCVLPLLKFLGGFIESIDTDFQGKVVWEGYWRPWGSLSTEEGVGGVLNKKSDIHQRRGEQVFHL